MVNEYGDTPDTTHPNHPRPNGCMGSEHGQQPARSGRRHRLPLCPSPRQDQRRVRQRQGHRVGA